MLRLLRSLSLLGLCFSSSVWAAYFQADLPSANANPALGVHLVITGKGMEVGDQWLRAGHTQALLFNSRKNHGNVRYIGAIENSESLSLLKKWGYQNIQVFNQTYTGPLLVKQILLNAKVASIDFIGHNGALLGFVLENYENRFFTDDAKALAPLAKRMSADSFVRVVGCNTGWTLAPLLAQVLKVPVAGTFTFSDIENLYNDREWYYHDTGRFPQGESILKQNDLSFYTPISCVADGGCTRLKPVRINYQGKHGNYTGTVPFLKFFCGALATPDCFRRMALSTTYLVGNVALLDTPTPSQFANLLADHFCPSYVNAQRKSECVQGILNHVDEKKSLASTYTTADGPSLTCDFQKCAAKVNCTSGTCVMEGQLGAKASTVFVDELNAYMKGYRLLTSSK